MKSPLSGKKEYIEKGRRRGRIIRKRDNERFTQVAIEEWESEDRRRRTWTDGKDDESREYKKGKRVTPGAGNTRNNIQIIKDKRKRTNKDHRKNVQHWSRLLNLIYFTVYIDMRYDYRPTRRRHPQAPI
jgi:hypothetical protein